MKQGSGIRFVYVCRRYTWDCRIYVVLNQYVRAWLISCSSYRTSYYFLTLASNFQITVLYWSTPLLRHKQSIFTIMESKGDSHRNYSQFACVGTGFSAIGLGATLKRWYCITDIRFFERNDALGGTWHANQYPGMALQAARVDHYRTFQAN